MGSMWIDPVDDTQYTVDPSQPPAPFDENYMVGAYEFPQSRWGADFLGTLVVIQFMATDWPNKISIDPPNMPFGPEMKKELAYLVDCQIKLRPSALPEIYAQNQYFQPYFVNQLGITAGSYPKTYLMLKMAARIGELVMVKLKAQWNAPRPSQVYPRLFPPVGVAPHASYPSGHSLVSHMMAAMATEIVPEMGLAPGELATRIAVNREIAGLHFPSDTAAGADAAAQAFKLFMTILWYPQALADAKAEWSVI